MAELGGPADQRALDVLPLHTLGGTSATVMEDIRPEAATEEWLPLGEALASFEQRLGDADDARHVLVGRAQNGDLVARAARAFGFFEGRELAYFNWPIPREFWHQLEEPSDTQWKRGDLNARLNVRLGHIPINRIPKRVEI